MKVIINKYKSIFKLTNNINVNNEELTKNNNHHQLKNFKTLSICHKNKNDDNISISENDPNIKINKLERHVRNTYINKTTLVMGLNNKTNNKSKSKNKNKKVVTPDNVSYFEFYYDHSILEDFNKIRNTNKIDINEKESCKPLRKRKLEESINNSLNNLNKKRNIINENNKSFLENNVINNMKKKKNNKTIKINELKIIDKNINVYKIIIETILNDKNKFEIKPKSKDKKVIISDNVSYFEFYSDHSIMEDFNKKKNTNKIDISENKNCKPLRKRKLEESINNSLNNINKKRNIVKKRNRSCLKSNIIKSMKKKNNQNIKINKLKRNDHNSNVYKINIETIINDKNTTITKTKSKNKNKKVTISNNISYFEFHSDNSILEDFSQNRTTTRININENENY